MSVKQELLKYLEENRGTSVSGQELAERLSVSRTAIWKAAKKLREAGYHIDAVNNKGYCLQSDNDILSEEGIRNNLDESWKEASIFVYPVLDSTNLEAKRKVISGAEEGTLIVADEQTMGRGRLGRSFVAPKEAGVYMTLVLRPELEAGDAVLTTTAAAVAVARAIRSVTGDEAKIKWVNDIYIGEKKVCGILTEAVSDFETGRIESAVLGIGINVRTDFSKLPEEVREVACSVNMPKDMPRNFLAAQVYNEFMKIYKKLPERSFLEDYRRFSNVIGHPVRFREKEIWYEGMAMDVDDNGGLIVKMPNGENRLLNTGEISLRRA